MDQNILKEALKILDEKKEQEFFALEQVKSQKRNILNRLITEFDLDNSSFWKDKVLLVNKYSIGKKDYIPLEDKQKFIQELKDLLVFRENQIKEWIVILNT